jgi:DNA-binding NarL/FixJ family response regulator
MTTDLGEHEPQRRLHPTAVTFDRHPLWLDGLERALARLEVFVVGRTTVPEHALALVAAHRPDLFVLSADEQTAAEWLQRARVAVPDLRAVVFTENGRPISADATTVYLSKTARADEVASALADLHPGFGRTAPATPENGSALTRRELEILQLVALGRTNAQIAKALWVTQWTVKFHLVNAFRKLGVTNRTEAARFVFEHGLVEEDDVARERA